VNRIVLILFLAAVSISSSLIAATLENHPQWKSEGLPELFYEVMAASVEKAGKLQASDGRFRERLPVSADESDWPITLMQYIYVPSLLYVSRNPANPLSGDPALLSMAIKAGDYLASCMTEEGRVRPRVNGIELSELDADRSVYCWAESMSLLENYLDDERRAAWRDALHRYGATMERQIKAKMHRPHYTSPFLGTSPNHLGWWAVTILRIGMVLENEAWVALAGATMHRFVREITPGGYWEEHDGPMMSYDYLNVAVAAIYWHYFHDPAAWRALEINLPYHLHWTTPDGVDIQTIDQRNRSRFTVMSTSWIRALMAFCHFPAGRRYSRFKLLAALGDERDPVESLGLRSLARLAADTYYYTPGPEAPIPQEVERYRHRLDRPAVVRKQGPWVYSYSAVVSPRRPHNQFYLDRICPISLWHEKCRQIIGGGNSKNQPELATFAVKMTGGEWVYLPLDALITGGGAADTICVAHEGFSLKLTIEPASEAAAAMDVQAERTYSRADTVFLNLPLKLIRRLSLPENARFLWPYYTYSPYGRDRVPRNIHNAVGVVSVPLEPDGSWLKIGVEVE
jgi:hypothetical protein